jgi:hypothetical protein
MDMKDFNDLFEIGRVTKTIKIAGHEIVMHTLNSNEYSAMAGALKEDDGVGLSKRLEALQREIVANAIETVDGKKLNSEEKSALVGMMQIGLSNMLYDEYGKMIEEQNKVLEDSKKNSA